MQYLNPFQLLDYPTPSGKELPGSDDIRSKVDGLLRKIEAGEWLSPEWATKPVTENEAKAVLKELDNPQLAYWHWRIAGQAGLLQFLNNGFVLGLDNISNLDSELGSGFRAFISPFFALLIREQVKLALELHNYRHLILLTFRHGFMVEEDQVWAYSPFTEFIQMLNSEIPKLPIPSLEITHWLNRFGNRFLVKSFNHLPASFIGLRSRMAVFLYHFAQKMLEEKNVSGAVVLVDAGLKLNMDQQYRNPLFQIKQNLLSLSGQSWEKMVENAKSVNIMQVSGPAKWKFDLKKHWPGLIGLAAMLVAIVGFFVYMLGSPGNTWEKSSTVIKSQRDFYNYRQWKVYDDSIKAIQLKMDGPRIFTLLNDYTAYSKDAPPATMLGNIEPATGFQPYIYEKLDHFHPGRLGTPVWFVNESQRDAVFFPICFDLFSFPQRHFYIRAGDSLLCSRLPSGKYGLLVYSGEEWNHTALNLTPKIWKRSEQIRAGAFEHNASLIQWPPRAAASDQSFTISLVGERPSGFFVRWTGADYLVENMEISIEEQVLRLDSQQTALEKWDSVNFNAEIESASVTPAPTSP